MKIVFCKHCGYRMKKDKKPKNRASDSYTCGNCGSWILRIEVDK